MRLRFALLLSLVWLACAGARAEVVVLACAEECTAAQFQGLELELRGYGTILSARPAPAGFTPTARVADAQRANELLGAAVTLWVEHEAPLRLCAYSRRGGSLHEAPLPAPPSTLDPAVFAAVAGSVALEALRATPAPTLVPAPDVVAPAPAAGPTAPARAAPSAPPPVEPQHRPPAEPSSWSKRFFVRAGVAVGFAMMNKNTPADRAPPAYRVEEAVLAQMRSDDPDAASDYLESTGYNCDVSWLEGDMPGIEVSDCTVAMHNSGVVWSSAIDLAAGINLTPRVALAATARIDPKVGMGPMAHALLGLQVEVALRQAKATGFWLSAALGLSGGQIQVRPPSEVKDTPYARSGLFGVRAGLLFGYRFLPRLGIVAAPVVHSLFPDTLSVVETNINLEVRI
jgi:hypothetical protein